MSEERTPEESRQRYIVHMGDEIGSLFYALWKEVAWLNIEWHEYVELYGTKPSRIDLLNCAAPQFARLLQDTLWRDVVLGVARLTDSAKSCGKRNLTIQALPDMLREKDAELAITVAERVKTAKQAADFCRDWRNRLLAHRDYQLAVGAEDADPLKQATRKKMKEALDEIEQVLNCVSSHFMNSTTIFESGSQMGGALSLLFVLDEGVRARNERKERIRCGEYRESDLIPREI